MSKTPVIPYINKPLARNGEYLEGSAYIGVASSQIYVGRAARSIHGIARRPGDGSPVFSEATKGQDAREGHIAAFKNTRHSWLMLLDGDMLFPPWILERLRSHGLPLVTGLYHRRTDEVVVPIWYEDGPLDVWPPMPFRGSPERGRMYRLAATGFGCLLVHRSVLDEMAPVLCGEPFVWEDDMDVWPYDLAKVVAGEEQIRVLFGTKDRKGADLRFCWFARYVGFTLWGDGAAACGHYINYAMGQNDWDNYGHAYKQAFAEVTTRDIAEIRDEYEAKRLALEVMSQ